MWGSAEIGEDDEYVTKDSGEKAVYSDGVQRDTQKGKRLFTLMFPKGVPLAQQLFVRVTDLYTRGAEKYSSPRLIGNDELVSWCSCENQTAILTGLTTLAACAETAMSEIYASATRSSRSDSDGTHASGPDGTGAESAHQIWLTAQELLTERLSRTDTADGPVLAWTQKTVSAYLLARAASARSAWTTSAQARTWIMTTVQAEPEVFFAHAVTKVWDSSETRQLVFGEHSPTCKSHQLLATSEGISTGLGRNWENSKSADTLAHHEDALWRHFMNFYFNVQDGEDHAAAIVWNINAVELTRRNLKTAEDGTGGA